MHTTTLRVEYGPVRMNTQPPLGSRVWCVILMLKQVASTHGDANLFGVETLQSY